MQRRPSLASPVTVGLLLLLVACGGPPNGGVPASTMVLKVDTTLSPGTTVTLPLRGDVDVTVRWGDGHVGLVTEGGDLSHTYAAEGAYTVTVSGSLTQFGSGFEAYENSGKLAAVTAWGALGLVSLAGAFRDAVHLTTVPADLPPTVTDASYLFRGATSFDQDIGGWDVGNVTNMMLMFGGAAFDQDLSGWSVTHITEEPPGFATGATAWVLPKPVWGTCP